MGSDGRGATGRAGLDQGCKGRRGRRSAKAGPSRPSNTKPQEPNTQAPKVPPPECPLCPSPRTLNSRVAQPLPQGQTPNHLLPFSPGSPRIQHVLTFQEQFGSPACPFPEAGSQAPAPAPAGKSCCLRGIHHLEVVKKNIQFSCVCLKKNSQAS